MFWELQISPFLLLNKGQLWLATAAVEGFDVIPKRIIPASQPVLSP